MGKKNKNEFVIGRNELENGCPNGTNALDIKNSPIPVESLKILMTGDSNDKFRIISKKITTKDVKLVLKHRETGDQFKIVAPIEFLEYHKIPYKFLVFPTNHQIEGVLQQRVRTWEVEIIIKDLSNKFDLVIIKDLGSDKKIACKVPIEEIQNTKLYIEKCKTYSQIINYDFEKINAWRENEWQKEIMMKINLLKSTQYTTQKKV